MARVGFAHVGVLEHFGKAHDGGERVVQFVRNAGHELADGGKFFALDELGLRGLERLDGVLELGLRELDVLGHLVEGLGQLAEFVFGENAHALGKIAMPHGLGGGVQFAQRRGGAVDEKEHDDRADKNQDDDGRQQNLLRAAEQFVLLVIRA